MENQHPLKTLIDSVLTHLSETRNIVKLLNARSNEHLSEVKKIIQDGKGSFPQVMNDMKRQASSVVGNALTIEVSLPKALDDIETINLRKSAPTWPNRTSNSNCVIDRSNKFPIGMKVDQKSEDPDEALLHAVVLGLSKVKYWYVISGRQPLLLAILVN